MGDNLNVADPPKANNFGEISVNKMICALSAIALEMQKFHTGTSISCHNFDHNEELSENLSICKSNLRLKKQQIKQLKENLRKACIVAKTIMSAKETVTTSLHNDINSVRNECASLYEKNKVNIETIKLLKTENQTLHEKIQHLHRFIELGYQELQKIRNIPINDAPTVIQLKEIMLSCGQYYADYCNEQESRMQIEQKNRFLGNKINILTTNLEAIMEQLKNLRFENNKLRKQNNILKNKKIKEIETNTMDIVYCNETICGDNNMNKKEFNNTSSKTSVDNDRTLDLRPHLNLVQSLLGDQDIMLRDLKNLSDEIKSSSITNTSE